MIFRRKKPYIVYAYGAPVLKGPAATVERIDGNILELGREMVQTMIAFEGIGLAAPQIGIRLKLMALNLPPKSNDPAEQTGSAGENLLLPQMPMVLVNPEIIAFSSESGIRNEGCLSIPEIYAPALRPLSIRVRGISLRGEVVDCECGGLLGRCIQHEVDHLEGMLFVDRLTPADFAAIEPDLKALASAGARNDYKRKIFC